MILKWVYGLFFVEFTQLHGVVLALSHLTCFRHAVFCLASKCNESEAVVATNQRSRHIRVICIIHDSLTRSRMCVSMMQVLS